MSQRDNNIYKKELKTHQRGISSSLLKFREIQNHKRSRGCTRNNPRARLHRCYLTALVSDTRLIPCAEDCKVILKHLQSTTQISVSSFFPARHPHKPASNSESSWNSQIWPRIWKYSACLARCSQVTSKAEQADVHQKDTICAPRAQIIH